MNRDPRDMRPMGHYHHQQDYPMVIQRERQLVPQEPEAEPMHVKLGRVSQNSARVAFKTIALIVVLITVLMGVGYAVIAQGPVSMRFMVKPLQAAIQRELPDVSVKIDDAVLQKAESGFGVVFRLKGVRLTNADGGTIAQAPSAAVGLSMWGLLVGKIAPASVHFIGPELSLVQSADGSVGLAFSQRESIATENGFADGNKSQSIQSGNTRNSLSNQIGETLAAAQAQQVDLVQSLSNLFKSAREGKDASSYLKSFGVRNALILVSTEKEQTEIRVPGIEVNVAHSNSTSVISGRARLSDADGPWDLLFRTELAANQDKITLWLRTNELSPGAFATVFPNVKILQALNIPINGLSKLDFSRSGELLHAETNLTLNQGTLNFSDEKEKALTVDHGRLQVRYNRSTGVIEVIESSLHWGGSHADFSGAFQPGVDKNGLKYWQFLLQTQDAALQTQEFGIPKRKIDNWIAKGFVIPSQKRINLDQLLIQAGNNFLDFSGDVIDAKGSPEVHLEGRISPMDIKLFKQLWPRLAAPGARSWIGERVTKGYITGGKVKISMAGGVLQKLAQSKIDIDEKSFSMELGIKNLETYYVEDLPPVRASAAVAKFSGRRFDMAIPKAHITLPSRQRMELTDGRFYISDLRGETQTGNIEFRTNGESGQLLEFLDLPPLGYLKEADFDAKSIRGQTDGYVRLSLPLIKEVKFSDMTMDGKLVLRNATFPEIVKGMKIGNGTITFGVTHLAVNAKGRIYVNGVPANIAWHRIYEGSADKQPGVRLSTILDADKLDKLGVPVSHFIKGEVPTDITIRSSDNGQQRLQLSANLTNTELIFGMLGWSKTAGKQAALEFDIHQMQDQTTQLRNFKIIGDDIAIKGNMSLGTDGKLQEFTFPDFSVNVVTRLSFNGKRDERDTWRINVKGAAYDGRQFFKSMFSSGKVSKGQKASRDTADVELSVDIDTVLGFSNSKMNNVKVYMQQREGRLSVLDARGDIEGGRIVAKLKYAADEARILRAEAGNAGYAFRLIGFYPNIDGGEAALQVNLDAAGGQKQTGTLWAQNFALLGDEIVNDVLASSSEDSGIVSQERRRIRRGSVRRERLAFDQLKVPFTIGGGIFELHDSFMNGPAVGVNLTGQVDFANNKISLGGTYIPAYALNTLFKGVPLVGDLLFNKGVVGITFGVEGDMRSPQVLVNPASVVAPGILRGLFDFKSPKNQQDVNSFDEDVFTQ